MPRKIFSNWVLLILMVSAIAFWQAALAPKTEKQPCVWFLDVGQGDATYIRASDGKGILIDAGSNASTQSALAGVMPIADKQINLLIITHLDKDHIGGADEILQNYEVKEIWWNGSQKDTKTFEEFFSALENEKQAGASILEPERFTTRLIGELEVSIVYSGRYSPDENANSLVVLVNRKDDDILIMGDLPKEYETEIPVRDIEVLRLGHHGSKTSTSDWLLDNFKPETAVISVGKNSYGHPHSEVLKRLTSRFTQIKRTDKEGTIKICF